MKKILSLMLLVLLCVASFTSCGGGIPAGVYVSEDGDEIEVAGNKLTMFSMFGEEKAYVVVVYEISEDGTKITTTYDEVRYDGEDADIKAMVDETNQRLKEESKANSAEWSFELGDGCFTLDGTTYTKK